MQFIAHRGNDIHIYKENTIAALNDSLNKKYISGIEFDIRITKDKKIIIYHNMLIKDNLNLFYRISNKTFNEIKSIDSNVSTLEEFLKMVKIDKILLIEIKEESDDYDTFIITLCELIKKYKQLNIYLCSFNYKLLKKIKSKYPSYKCGLIIGYLMNTKNMDDIFDFFLYSYNYIEIIDYNKEIFIFTINKKDKLEIIKRKIKNNYYIISDNCYSFI